MKSLGGSTGIRFAALLIVLLLIAVAIAPGSDAWPHTALSADHETVEVAEREAFQPTLDNVSGGAVEPLAIPCLDQPPRNDVVHDLPSGCVVDLGPLSGELGGRGSWSSGCDSTNRAGSHARFYSFSVIHRTEVQIGLTSGRDGFLNLLEGSGTGGHVIISNDNAEEGDTDALIRISLAPGTYTVEAATSATQQTGEFILEIQAVNYRIQGFGSHFPETIEAYRFDDEYVETVRDPLPCIRTHHGKYWVLVPTAYTNPREAAEKVDRRLYGSRVRGERIKAYKTMLLEIAIRPASQPDVFVDFPEFRDFADTAAMVGTIADAYIEVDKTLLETHLHHLVHHSDLLPIAAFGTFLFDAGVSAAANRAIEVGRAKETLAALEAIIPAAMPEDEAWPIAFQQARADLDDMTSPNGMTRWQHELEENLEEIAAAVAKLIIAKVATKVVVGTLHLVAAKFVIATAPVSLTVGLIVTAVVYFINQRDEFWDELTFTGIAAQLYASSRASNAIDDETLDYIKFSFYQHLHKAAEVDFPGVDSQHNQPKYHRTEILSQRDLALRDAMDSTDWNPASDFNVLRDADNEDPKGIWSDATTMWVMNGDVGIVNNVFAYNMETRGREIHKELQIELFDVGQYQDIWSDTKTMWMSRNSPAPPRIYAYDMGSKKRDKDKEIDPRHSFSSNRDPRGIWSDETTIWVASNDEDKIYAYNLENKQRDKSKDFNALNIARNNSPRGIWSDGSTMWVVDDQDDKVYAYDMVTYNREPARELALLNLPGVVGNADPVGLWANGTTMWVSDYGDDKIFAYQMPPRSASIEYAPFRRKPPADFGRLNINGNDHAEGISSGLTTMWVVDHDDDVLYGYDVRTKALVRTITALRDSGNGHARGIWTDGTTIWVADHHDDKVYGYNLDDPGDRTLWQNIDIEAAGNLDATGIWSDGITMWVADDDDDSIYGYDMENPEDSSLWRSVDIRTRFTTPQGHFVYRDMHPEGIWSDGSTMWVADHDSDWIYAFSLSDGSRVIEMEFRHLRDSGNGHATGIWSDGSTMWVGDHHDDWVYAYQMPPGITPVQLPPAEDSCLQSIAVGGTATGEWAEGCESLARDGSYARFYSFTLDEETEVTISLESEDADSYLYLRDGDAHSGAALNDHEDDDDAGGGRNSQAVETLDAGAYTIEATTYSAGETGNFTLTITALEATNDCEETLTADGTVSGTWAAGCDSEERTGSHARYYTFALSETSEVTITLESDDADSYLYLRDGNALSGAALNDHDEDDDAGGGSNALIVETLDEGTYTIEATTYSAGETGDFTLTISDLSGTGEQEIVTPDTGSCFNNLGPLAGAVTVTTDWTGDCASIHREGKYARFYAFTLGVETEVEIKLTSTVDTYLNLLEGADSGGRIVGYNDDEEPGVITNSLIERILSVGTYTVEATTYDSAATGSFTLTITPTPTTGPTAPDLVVESLGVSPGTLAVGDHFTLRATVRNQGTGAASSTTLRYYRSIDSAIDRTDTPLGTDSVGGLAANAPSSQSIGLVAPSSAGTYYYGACVDPVPSEANTRNNCSVQAALIVTEVQAVPDLAVYSPSVYDKAYDPGQRFSMSFWVRNEGGAASTANAGLRYFRSSDSAISTSDAELTIVNGTTGMGPLAPSASTLVTINLTAHSSGTYYYGACVSTAANETNTGNNCAAVFKVRIKAPDLVADSLSVSENNPEPGTEFTVSVRVRNQGDRAAGATTLRYYQSAGSIITSSDTEVSTDAVSSLDPNRSSRQSTTVSAPSAAGTYYYGACVDAVSGESDTGNNCSSSLAVTITGTSETPPDLVVQTPTVSRSIVTSGSSFTLRVGVHNQGVGESAATTLRYYRSTDSTITGSDTPVGTDPVGSVNVNGTSAQSVSLTAPSVFIGRTYYYGACVDPVVGESSTDNNCSTGAAVRVTPPVSGDPDLRASASVSNDLLRVGASFTLRASVSNQGNRGGGSSAPTTLRFYRSTDSTISSADTEEGTAQVGGLSFAQSRTLSIDLAAPSSAGTYYYGACIDAVSGETNTQNNCSSGEEVIVQDTLPDLVVESPSVNDSNLNTRESFTFSATVRNQGDGTAPVTTLRYYRSTDSTITTGDALMDTDSVNSLDAGETSDESESLTTPTSAGTYYIGACVDAVAGESNTQNNCSSGVQITVTGTSQATPDLVIQSASTDKSSVGAGGTLTLSATVLNQGDGSSAETTLRYYRSTNSTINTSDAAQGTDPIPVLAASRTSPQSIELTVPTRIDTYYFGACVDEVAIESNTQNNCSDGVAVEIKEVHPDLILDTPTVDDSNLETGEGFRLSITVRNQGDGRPDDATTLRYYRSTDSTISSSDTEVGTDEVSRVRPSESSSESIDLTAPSTAGTYYYGGCVDSATGESDTTNNCSGSVEVTVTQGNPDLVVESPSVNDDSLDAGAAFTLRASVRNQGDHSAPATTIRYYRSTDSTISSSDTEVGTDNVRDLAAAETSSESIGLIAPATAGTYYYGACVDSVTDESDTTNNCSTGVQVTVTGTVQTYPDLVAESPSVDDKHLDPDDSLDDDFRFTVTVRNAGDASSAETTLRYYQSTDSTITTGDTQVDTDTVGVLTASETDVVRVTLDAPTTSGTYYFGACVDSVTGESNTTNNCSSGVEVISSKVGDGNPDLVVQSPSVSNNNVAAGTSITVGGTVKNQGTGRSPESRLRFYRSSDSTITTGDTEMDSDGIDTLGPTETTTTSDSFLAPGDAGTYYFGACVDSVSRESDTTNNCSSGVSVTVTGSATVGPDLVVESPSADESVVGPGDTFTLSVTVRNQGNTIANSTTLRYYRSSDSTITTGDTEVDTDDVSRLDPNETDDESDSPRVPETEGVYYYGACVDSVTDETDTTNNCSTGVKITVKDSDLIVQAPTVNDSTPDPGTSFTLSATVKNQGGERSGSTTLRYYRSTDSTISTSDTEVGTDGVSGLNPDSTSDESITLTAPSTNGTYYYGGCVDSVTDESDTSNNCSSSVSITITGGTQSSPDLVVESVSVDDDTVEAEDDFRLRATVRNQGTGDAAATTLRYYRSTDSTITTGDTEVSTDSVSALSASGSSRESERIDTPATTGVYYYGVCVDSVSGESNTQNNCSSGFKVTVSSGDPDLVVTLTFERDVTGSQVYIDLDAVVRNQGPGSSSSTTLRYYRSTDRTISSNDTQVATDSVRSLGPQDTSDESYNFSPASIDDNTYYYYACVDSVTDESNTNNNCSSLIEVDHGD